ncbi:hypothetical protein [Dysgonomonas sp. 511]|uniref:hypothetical protein n=1 Tax=Dysgonomonas sp. 511 TaxID=2302930 RepID=UPI0013D7AF76|nr:hypothetical protein [Dysgonomonas sp. 511]NDV77615.1 hypothetical protein [Dysgonomonas sp. 511]
MKNWKFYILSFFALSLACKITGQSRMNNNPQLQITAQSEKLRSATGWKQDITGNWISNANVISDSQVNDANRGRIPQNFNWLQFVSLKHNNRIIYAVLYENAMNVSETKNERRVHFFFITEKDYAGLVASVKKKNAETKAISSTYYGYISDNDGDFTPQKLFKQMVQILSASNQQQYSFAVNAQHVDNEDVVRFRLPEQFSETKGNLLDNYFEVKYIDFDKILLPAPSVAEEKGEFDLGAVAPVATVAQVGNTVLPQQGSREDDIADRSANVTEPDDTTTPISVSQADAGQALSDTIVEEELVLDRKNRERARLSAPIAALGGIQGWYHTPDGDWVNDKSHLYDFETVGRYEMRNLTYKENNYVLIVRHEKYAGEVYYLVSKDDYLQAVNNLESSSMLELPVIAYAGIGNRLEDVVEICEKAIDAPQKEDAIIFNDKYLVVQYRLSAAKNISRFFIFLRECSRYGSADAPENCLNKVSMNVKYADEHLLMTDQLFSKMYYESSYNNFIGFFRRPLK